MADPTHPTPWKPRVRPPQDGEAVSSSIASRGHLDNEQRTRHLKEILDEIEVGRILVLRDQPFEAGMKQWAAVYLDTDGVWKPALAELVGGGLTSSQVVLSARSYSTGLVLYKDQDTIGGVLISGSTTAGEEILDVLDGPFVPGIYYLSQLEEGNMTISRPAAAVRLATMQGPSPDGRYRIFLQPTLQGELSDHLHYHIELVAEPSGTPNCVPPWEGPYLGQAEETGPYPGILHEVADPDVDVPGWLPADHTAFDGMLKPDGAKFGYNIAQDERLASIWPPIPAGYGYVEVNNGYGSVGISGSKVIINEFGIWWMDDTYGNAPWSPDYSPCLGAQPEPSSSSSNQYKAPFFIQIDFWFTRITFGAQLYVTSLTAADSSLLITDPVGQEADAGDLIIRLNDLTEEESFDPTVIKNLRAAEGIVERGMVVGGIRSLSPSIIMQGGEVGDDGYRRGNINMSFLDPSSNRELVVNPVSLNNVQEESYDGTLLLNLPASRASEIRGKVSIDATTLVAGTKMELTLKFWLLARQTVTLSSVAVGLYGTYRITLAATGCTEQTLPTSAAEEDLVFDQLCTNELSANEYVEVTMTPIEVSPGDVVHFSFGKGDGAFAVGILKQVAQLEVVEE